MSSAGSESRSLQIAVVGHTNTGKTSLLRTLARDAGFGEVADAPATTRQVEGIALSVPGFEPIHLYDTPGLEQAGDLLDGLEGDSGPRYDGPARLQRFLTGEQAAAFEQEARVIAQAMASDVVLYVIDAREPVLEKFQDELAILAMTARPVLPVLNFVSGKDARESSWREALARVGLHAVASFDTVVFDLEAELRVWRHLATMLDDRTGLFDALMAERRRETDWRRRAAARRSAVFLLDVAALRWRVPRHEPAVLQQTANELREQVCLQEDACMADLLELYRFVAADYQTAPSPEFEALGRSNPFDPEVLRDYGLTTGKFTGGGAAVGAAVDVAFFGLSLGTATLAGAALGAGAGAWRQLGPNLRDRLGGYQGLLVDDAVLAAFVHRQRRMLSALAARGHASQQPITGDPGAGPVGVALPRPLRRARGHPEWSALGRAGTSGRKVVRPDSVVEALADCLLETVEATTTPKPSGR